MQYSESVHKISVGDKVGVPGGIKPEFPGIDEHDVITRIIDKPNNSGTVIFFESGKKIISEPGQQTYTQTPEGLIYKIQDGKLVENIPNKAIKPEQKRLNVASCSTGIGKLLSNFTKRPFSFHGKSYQSVEAFYQSLKWPSEEKRAEIANLSDTEAKRSGKGAPKSSTFIFDDNSYQVGSGEHQELIKSAIKASLDQNPEIKREFIQTFPRPIVHLTGRPENPNTALPAFSQKYWKILDWTIKNKMIVSLFARISSVFKSIVIQYVN